MAQVYIHGDGVFEGIFENAKSYNRPIGCLQPERIEDSGYCLQELTLHYEDQTQVLDESGWDLEEVFRDRMFRLSRKVIASALSVGIVPEPRVLDKDSGIYCLQDGVLRDILGNEFGFVEVEDPYEKREGAFAINRASFKDGSQYEAFSDSLREEGLLPIVFTAIVRVIEN